MCIGYQLGQVFQDERSDLLLRFGKIKKTTMQEVTSDCKNVFSSARRQSLTEYLGGPHNAQVAHGNLIPQTRNMCCNPKKDIMNK